jgi:hypothetical protein
MIIRNEEDRICIAIDVAVPGEECNAKGGWQQLKIQKLKHRNSANVECEITCHIGSRWGHR